MLHFFRQIRQKILTENRFSKYLLYAVGEIILVVIGILIAIQVDRWNETRKLQEEEFKILRQLESEFVHNQQKLDSIYAAHKEVNRCLRSLIAVTGPNPDPIPQDSLDYYIREFSHIPTYHPNSASVSSLLSTGKLVLISNDSLKLLLSSWPEQLEIYHYEAGLNYDLYNFHIAGFLAAKYLYRNTEVDAGRGTTGRSLFHIDPQQILADPELENLAELKRVDSEALEVAALKLSNTQTVIIQLIKGELINNR